MKRRVSRSRDEWRRLVEEQKASGLSVRVFCQRETVGLGSFYRWKRLIADVGGHRAMASGEGFIDMGELVRLGCRRP